MKSAINMAWEHGGADFQSRFDKSTAQAQEMKEGALQFCDGQPAMNIGEILIWESTNALLLDPNKGTECNLGLHICLVYRSILALKSRSSTHCLAS